MLVAGLAIFPPIPNALGNHLSCFFSFLPDSLSFSLPLSLSFPDSLSTPLTLLPPSCVLAYPSLSSTTPLNDPDSLFGGLCPADDPPAPEPENNRGLGGTGGRESVPVLLAFVPLVPES